MQNQTQYCITCKSYEQHSPLTKEQKEWLKQTEEYQEKYHYIHDFFMCMKPECRNTRTGGNKQAFEHPVRIPQELL